MKVVVLLGCMNIAGQPEAKPNRPPPLDAPRQRSGRIELTPLEMLAIQAALPPPPARTLCQTADGAWQRTPTNVYSTNQCLGCHDGTIGVDVAMVSLKHMIGSSYLHAYLKPRSRLMPPFMLDRRLVLVNGTIQCITCHARESNGAGQLAIPLARSSLCRSCHRM